MIACFAHLRASFTTFGFSVEQCLFMNGAAIAQMLRHNAPILNLGSVSIIVYTLQPG